MTKYIILGVIASIAIFCAGYFVGGSKEILIIEDVRVDTIRVSIPTPLDIYPKLDESGERVTVQDMLPIIEIIESEMVEVVRVVDTLWAQVPISTYSFGDDKWSAQVSGYRVIMESMEVYNTTTTSTIIKPPEWEISAMIGVDPYSQWVGGSATHHWGRLRATIDVGYNFKDSSPYIRAQGGITLFER